MLAVLVDFGRVLVYLSLVFWSFAFSSNWLFSVLMSILFLFIGFFFSPTSCWNFLAPSHRILSSDLRKKYKVRRDDLQPTILLLIVFISIIIIFFFLFFSLPPLAFAFAIPCSRGVLGSMHVALFQIRLESLFLL